MREEFRVGMKVVCVDDSRGALNPDAPGPWVIRNNIYTISGLGRTVGGVDGVDLLEFPILYDGTRFRSARFRPLEEKPDSVEQFREIARGVSGGKPIIEDAEYRLPTPERVRAEIALAAWRRSEP